MLMAGGRSLEVLYGYGYSYAFHLPPAPGPRLSNEAVAEQIRAHACPARSAAAAA